MKGKEHRYTNSCKDFWKNVQYLIKIFVKKSNSNVSEQLILILKHSGLLKQSFDIMKIRWSKGHIFV